MALYVSEQLEAVQLCRGGDAVRIESLWVRIKGQANRGDIVVGVSYRPLDQEEEVDEAFHRQLKVASLCKPWFLWGTLTTPRCAGETAQLRTNGPRGYCRTLQITS